MRAPFYRQPRFVWTIGAILILGLVVLLYLDDLQALIQLDFSADFWRALVSFGFAIAAPLVAQNLIHALVSQFVMPVYSLEERKQARDHFLRYSSGLPGPAIFVKEGQLVASAEEKSNLNLAAGVILVDNTSGVVLRTDTQLTRAEGSGVVFTRPGEYTAGGEALDLRKQARRVEQVRALTRDGIEVKVDIGVTFMLESGEPKPLHDWTDPRQPPHAFSKENALKAFYGRTYRDNEQGEWAELPALLANDVWREQMMQRDFGSLFSSRDTSMALLDGVQYQIQSRLMGTGSDENSRESRVLAERGLRVLGVSLSGLTLPEDVRRKHIENWRKDWEGRAGEMAAEKDPGIRKCRQEGQAAGREHALVMLAQYVREQLLKGRRPSLPEAAVSLAEATRRLAQDPSAQSQPNGNADLRKMLEDMELWAKRLQSESPDRR